MFRIAFLALLVLVAFSPAFGQQYVEVFATSVTSTGNLGGLSGADTTCTDTATAAGLSGNWVAWLSTGAEDARDRIVDSEYRLLDGTVIANDLADLTDGNIDNAIDVDENGNDASGSDVWTGTLEDGTVAPDTCNEWTDGAITAEGLSGDTDLADGGWTEQQPVSLFCSFDIRLYCFSAVEVPVELQEFSVD